MSLPAICLTGPTAAGKTALALELRHRLPCEIISVDSAMVYRGLDIGTAKPEAHVRAQVPHQLIDVCSPREAYSVGRFHEDAAMALERVRATGRIPLLVGGSGLYFRALEHGLTRLPAADAGVRMRLEQEAAGQGWPALHRRLAEMDPKSALRIHPHDGRRIQRALEVLELCGCTLSDCWEREPAVALLEDAVWLVVAPVERTVLHDNIRRRFYAMLDLGLEAEVQDLHARGELPADRPASRLVGYKEVLAYQHGSTDRVTMIDRALAATRGLARRQLTWLRARQGGERFDGGIGPERLCARVLRYLQRHSSAWAELLV